MTTITIRIADPETIEAYKDVHPELIFQDMMTGTLLEHCELVPTTQEQEWQDIAKSLRIVTEYAARKICSHDETYRGGAIWEICSMCGAKWADDRGGRPADAGKMPKEIEQALELLAIEKSARGSR